MQLLGTYNSDLASFQYQQLLALLQAALATGDLSSGSAFDKTTLMQLESQATSFANIPVATAGTRAQDESLLQPLSLLQARFTALLSEANSFVTRSESLIAFLQAESDLLDQLLAEDGLSNWVANLPSMPPVPFVWSQDWDFSVDQGKISQLILPKDPSNGVLYPSKLATGSRVFLGDTSGTVTAGVVYSGLLPPSVTTVIPAKQLSWTLPAIGTPSEFYSPDMSATDLTLVEDIPQVSFTSAPNVQVLLPLAGGNPGLLSVSGSVPGGALPTYLRLLFYPRISQTVGRITDAVPFPVSAYTIDPDNVIVYAVNSDGTIGDFYSSGSDFTIDQTGSITSLTIGTGVSVIVRFSENFPAYQCSVDQINWSDVHMLDLNRPFRDDETSFLPVGIVDNKFPLTDETGLATGLFFQLNTVLDTDYTLLISTPGASSYGPTCTLKVNLDQQRYCNAVSIKPFNSYPATLISVELEGLISTSRTAIFGGSILVDRDMQITFPRQIVSAIYLTFVQENYTIIEYQDLSTDSLRRSTMATVEASLPFSLGSYIPPVSVTKRGYQYDLGFEDIEGLDITPVLPGVIVQGPFTVAGCPLILRYDAESAGGASVYFCYQAFSSTGSVLDQNLTGIAFNTDSTIVVPYTSGTNLSLITSVQISLKFVLRTPVTVFSRYNLQAVLR
jgi:hypothetical protein